MSDTCNNRLPGKKICGTPLTPGATRFGKTVHQCHRCMRRAHGDCWACGARRTNHIVMGLYCDPCSKEAKRVATAHAHAQPAYRQRAAAYWKAKQADPQFRLQKNAYARAWKQKRKETERAV